MPRVRRVSADRISVETGLPPGGEPGETVKSHGEVL